MAAAKNPQAVESDTPDFERGFDPQREELKRKQQLDWLARQNPGEWVDLPNGERVKVQPGMPFKYPGDETHPMFDHPGGIWNTKEVVERGAQWHLAHDSNGDTTSILAQPKPPFVFGGIDSHRYGWFVRTPAVRDDRRPAETASLHRQERIRYIETSEVDKHSPIAIYEEHATPNNTYVTSGTMILAEIMDPKLSYQKYKGWDDLAIRRVMTIPETIASSSSVLTDSGPVPTHVPGKTVAEVDGPRDSRRGS